MSFSPVEDLHATPKEVNSEDKNDVETASTSSISSSASLLVDIMCGSKDDEDSEAESDEWDRPAVDDDEVIKQREEIIKSLRILGYPAFLEKHVFEQQVPIRLILKKLGISLPTALDDFEDLDLLPLLKEVLKREASRRLKLPQYNTIDDVVKQLHKAKNVVVLVGAGISTSLGILDFRSDNGFYARLAQHGLSEPSEMFDIHTFREEPGIFYTFAKELLPETHHYSPSHAFIRLLEQKNKLSTLFTQNIDNLERETGLSEEKVVQCHGSFATATCIQCKHKVEGSLLYDDIRNQRLSYCTECNKPPVKKRKLTSASDRAFSDVYNGENEKEEEEEDIPQAGVMKPDITFFGEALPDQFFEKVGSGDLEKTDLLICIGTSLKVAPVSELISLVPASTPQIYISRTPVRHTQFDVNFISPFCDWVIVELCKRAGWLEDLEKLCNEPKCHTGAKNRAWNTSLDVRFHEPSTYYIKSKAEAEAEALCKERENVPGETENVYKDSIESDTNQTV
ncbi:histone deacetylase, Sirtuin family, NAD-dependent Sir2 [Schizosaccharomyces osmophilus]|uniref:Histone deacetylase, Sirtuin family, NAD-dependent Sir2 n=1 Tax=Schizosaccharomyces osmophilus TaxID=2545709 RepID=A0AAE9W602_9SCHI|nr:histone deacetylase, Sirtuin family, NAD-dependent Sir2 [Schizosaccharomyces osmophilus]WBW70755.1 histone deacetylase, Sirtuin family, NAD-dependent Sir2 [Schizosaccharomyces osmophilus]